MRSIRQRIERNMEVLTELERRHFHVLPEKAKVGANVGWRLGDDSELSADYADLEC